VSLQYAALPFTPTAALSVGQSDLLPATAGVSVLSLQRTEADKTGFENPLSFLAGRFDLSFAVVYLFPLIILALSYNLLSGEREQGTLQLLLSQPVSLRSIALGKAALRALLIFGLVAPVTLIGLILSGADRRDGGFLTRLSLWVVAVVIYGAFWFALAILVNSFGRNSATNAMALAGLWLVLALLLPALLNVAVTTIYPVPSRVEMVQATRRATAEATAKGSQLLARYVEDHPELTAGRQADPNDFYTRSIAVQDETERLIQPVIDHFDRQALGQQSLLDRFRFLSPAIVAQSALNDVAGTGAARYRHFISLVDEFHQSWRAHFTPRIVQKALLTADDYDRFPAFRFREEPASAIARRALVGLIGLLVPALLTGWLGLRALRRYSVAS
jgi:ABC-2 type transport system permease protein